LPLASMHIAPVQFLAKIPFPTPARHGHVLLVEIPGRQHNIDRKMWFTGREGLGQQQKSLHNPSKIHEKSDEFSRL
jgi:hypothetical protein